MMNDGDIRSSHKNIPYFCKNLSSLLTDATTTDLIFSLARPTDPAIAQEHRSLLDSAHKAQHRQAELHDSFPAALFRDASWTIMLACFTALLEGRTQCVKQIQSLLDESHTSVLRHIDALEAHRLVGRQRDPEDGRRTLVLLSGRGTAAMAHYLNGFCEDHGAVATKSAPAHYPSAHLGGQSATF